MNENEIKRRFNIISEEVKPKPRIVRNCFRAFWVGGLICLIGQIIFNFLSRYDFTKEIVSTYTSIIMVFLGALLTGIGIYDRFAEYAGAGTIVPITGFSNAMVSQAIEFKREGYVLGVTAKMFNIAGPVIVYGIGSSVIVGIIYYFILKF